MTALLEVEDVRLHFGVVKALQDVSMEVPEGSVVGLIGPNGAGKTTLFNVISGLYRADAGSIRFDGAEIAGTPSHSRAALGIGRSFQNLGLMVDETAATNVLAALHRSAPYRPSDVFLRPWRRTAGERQLERRCAGALHRFELDDDADRLVSELSFAKARFVELAAVVAEDPRLMLLDEPTTGLDVAEVRRLTEILAAIREQGTTVLVVAHDVEFVMKVCDHVYVLAEGQCLFDGAPSAVRSNPAVIEAYLGTAA
jgi:branched-chain amino acid transport system ATP-binding protein